jgi:hypothetical protein
MGVFLTFCLGRPQTAILLISTSQIAGIAGMYHCAQPFLFHFNLQKFLYFHFNFFIDPSIVQENVV